MRKLFLGSLALLSIGLVYVANAASEPTADDDKPKHSISDVMMKAHGRGGLRSKLQSGRATKEEKELLLEMYVDMGKGKPPKGDAASWKKRTDAIVKATKDFIKDPKAKSRFDRATSCKDCHDPHKGD